MGLGETTTGSERVENLETAGDISDNEFSWSVLRPLLTEIFYLFLKEEGFFSNYISTTRE